MSYICYVDHLNCFLINFSKNHLNCFKYYIFYFHKFFKTFSRTYKNRKSELQNRLRLLKQSFKYNIEFALINNVLKEFYDIKEDIKNSNNK